MAALTFSASARHRDGTRGHEIHEGANFLFAVDHPEDGHFDLMIESRLTGSDRPFCWDVASRHYQPVVDTAPPRRAPR